jgi:hypothetical protein
MPSSISSSEPHRRARGWIGVWLVAISASVIALIAIEFHWRHAGYTPTVIDSKQLWSSQRDRVYADSPRPLVLLGASRTEYSIDPAVLRDELPGYEPVMLALDGLYPLAVLHDLADDPRFHGVVLCDIEPDGFVREFQGLQQPWVDYYHQRWTPSWRLHRRLLTDWQRNAVIANPEFGLLASLRHTLSGGEPFRNYVEYHADRSGDIDYRKTDPEALKRHFSATAEGNVARMPKRTPEEWLQGIAPVFDWVRAIRDRGGEVIFYESPTHGFTQELNERRYPRDRYWNHLAQVMPAAMLSAHDVPALASTPLPDDSHLDFRDKATYTRTLAHTLLERGLLKPSTAHN